jgi:hypothetical protein
MKRRASTCLFYERPRKVAYIFLRLHTHIDICRKRLREHSESELAPLLKRLNLAPENRGEIGLSVKEIKLQKNRTRIYLHPSLWEYYSWGLDPRDWYATDIQRIFRGWLLRKNLRFRHISNSFI